MSQFRAPLPNLGNCSTVDNWPDSSMIKTCTDCVTNKNEKRFFCGGKCMSPYDMRSVCPTNQLVAKNAEQCKKPCVQVGGPSFSGGCSDNYDCKADEKCVLRSVPKQYKNRGFCEKTKPVKQLPIGVRDIKVTNAPVETSEKPDYLFPSLMGGFALIIVMLLYLIYKF